MATLQGPVIYPTVRAKRSGVNTLPLNGPLMKTRILRNGFWGFKGNHRDGIRLQPLSHQSRVGRCMTVRCTFSSSSNGNGSMAENFNENDGEYVNSSVMEAVEVRSGSDGFMIKMRDGKHLRCVHNNPQGGHLPDYAPHPAIVLKMEDGSDLLLPIIVLEMPSMLLMAAVRNVQIARPTVYQIIKEMIEKMGYTVKLVRVTKRVHEAYFAQLYLAKVGNETERVSFDLRPSDAINIAVRCKSYIHLCKNTEEVNNHIARIGGSENQDAVLKYNVHVFHFGGTGWIKEGTVPIQVNKYLAYSDGMKVVEASKMAVQPPLSDGLLFTELDRPDGQPCVEAKEFDLIRNMLIAAVEERYRDAAQWRDKLTQLRSQKQKWT